MSGRQRRPQATCYSSLSEKVDRNIAEIVRRLVDIASISRASMTTPRRYMALLLSLLIFVSGCFGEELSGEPIPDYSFVADDGETYSKESMEGKKYIMHFTASWCPRCFKSMHNITDAIDGVELLVLSTDASDANKLLQWHNEADESNSTQNLDIPFMVGAELAEEMSIDAMPTLVLVDKNGDIVDQHEGDLTAHDEIIDFWNQD